MKSSFSVVDEVDVDAVKVTFNFTVSGIEMSEAGVHLGEAAFTKRARHIVNLLNVLVGDELGEYFGKEKQN